MPRGYVSNFEMEIREKILQGFKSTQLVKLYKGLTLHKIIAIAKKTGIMTGRKYKSRVLTEDELKKIEKYRGQGISLLKISLELRLSKRTIYRLNKKHNWKVGGICRFCGEEITEKNMMHKKKNPWIFCCRLCLNKRYTIRYKNDPEFRKKENKRNLECKRKRRKKENEQSTQQKRVS